MTVLLRENLIQLFDEVLHFVTLCYTLLNAVLHTYTVLHFVTLCYTLLNTLLHSYTLLHFVTQLHFVTLCYIVLYIA